MVIDARQHTEESLPNLTQMTKGEVAIIELAVGESRLHKALDKAGQPRGRGVGLGARGGLHHVGEHQDARLAGLGPGTRIAVDLLVDVRTLDPLLF